MNDYKKAKLQNAAMLQKQTRNSCRWQTHATCCITANMLQTNVDTQCDKLATKLIRQHLQQSTFLSYSTLFVESHTFSPTPPAFGTSVGGDRVWLAEIFAITKP